MSHAELASSLALGPVGQIGFVVRDLTEAVARFEGVLGFGPFRRVELRPDKMIVRGRERSAPVKVGVAHLRPGLSMELVEGAEGGSCEQEFLERRGEGVYCLGFFPADWEGALARAKQRGIAVHTVVETEVEGLGRVRAAFLDTQEAVGVVLKVLEVGSAGRS